ncbi:MAG: hypothetical protein IT257_05895 [Chitinophagaceae bacterium]|nr:hypothetical protein [Chitinophagaceae bacterium]
MKFIFSLILSLSFIATQAHIDSLGFRQCFESKSIKYFKKLAEFQHSHQLKGCIYVQNSNPVIGTFMGGTILIGDGEAVYDSYNLYQINILTQGDTIIYYDFSNNHQNSDRPVIWFNNLFTAIPSVYKNESGLNALSREFRKNFNAPFRDSVFFRPSFFGIYCGEGGVETSEHAKIRQLIVSKKSPELLNLLFSSNTYDQLWGYYGFHMLAQSGYKLSADVQNIMHVIENKKGNLSACDGCLVDDYAIDWLIENIIKRETPIKH